MYLFIVVQFSRTDLSLLRNLSLTACILYHITQRLSRPFCKVFRVFSQTLSSAPSLPFALLSDPLGCDLVILSHLLRFVKCFFKISHRLFSKLLARIHAQPQGLRSLLKKRRKISLIAHPFVPAPGLSKYWKIFDHREKIILE